MRLLLRILITWAILLLVGYFWGLPYAAQKLRVKTQSEMLAQCDQQLRDKGLIGAPNAALTQAQGDQYCHCLADPLTFTSADIMEMVRTKLTTGEKKPPARLEAQVKTQVDTCNPQLQQAIISKYGAQPAAPAAPAPSQTITIQ